MLFFYRYNRRKIIRKNYRQAFRLAQYNRTWALWFLLIKFNALTSTTVPKLQAWCYRSLYTNKLHFNNKKATKKALLLHLFWVLDIWQFAPHGTLRGFSTTFPIRFEAQITDNLQVYATFTKWLSQYILNKDKALPYKVTNRWLPYKVSNWLTHKYTYYTYWYLPGKRQLSFRQRNLHLWFLNRWYIENNTYHHLHTRFLCQIPKNLPQHYTKILWLRLLRYPCLYNYKWFTMVKHLNHYAYRTSIPWELTYKTSMSWLFDYRSRGLVHVLKALVSQRTQITEHIFVKRWKDLLLGKDAFSQTFQIFIRTSTFFSK